MAATSYRFGDRTFETRKAVVFRLREIHARTEPGTRVSPRYEPFLRDLARCHPETRESTPDGWRYTFTDPEPGRRTVTFWAQQNRRKARQLVITDCIEGVGATNRALLRALVAGRFVEFMKCRPIYDGKRFSSQASGRLFPIAEGVIDHAPLSFRELTRDFCSARSVDMETELLTVTTRTAAAPEWTDPTVPEAFVKYHQEFGLLLVHRSETREMMLLRPNVMTSSPVRHYNDLLPVDRRSVGYRTQQKRKAQWALRKQRAEEKKAAATAQALPCPE